MKAVCVYCGSSLGRAESHADAARALGAALVRRGLGLVYGGAQVGVMGVLANAVLDLGGRAVGVIPEPLMTKEVAHTGLTELLVTQSMHERKAAMAERADGFIALPGGVGTLEEIFEMWTWGQLGIHQKPLGLLNADGYFDPLAVFLDHAVDAQYVQPTHRAMLFLESDPDAILDHFEQYVAPAKGRWTPKP